MNYYPLYGDFECLKAAIQNGADSVYLGASSFSARSKAKNFNLDELKEAIKYAKLRNVKTHLTLNILIKNEEFEDAVKLAINAYNLGIDAIIIQDLGLATYLLENYPEIPLHASTQMTVHNLAGVKQMEKLGFSRVVLSRELSFDEIKYIRENSNIELEVFIHGALCISYSGQCLLSSMIGGRSGNRGNCAQPCRLKYDLVKENVKTKKETTMDTGYLMSPKDNLGLNYLADLIKIGIDSIKIEGRMKTPTYVGTVTRIYRKYVDLIYENINKESASINKIINEKLNIKNDNTNLSDYEELLQVFNRGGFSTGHFNPKGNNDLIFKEKPNNMGIFLGNISNINTKKGYLTLTLKNSLSILDKISINNNIYTVSELMINNSNIETANSGSTVIIGRMKGNIGIGSNIYKIESSKLNKSINNTINDKNIKKIRLNGKIIIKEDTPISLKIYSNDGFYNGLEFTAISDNIPEKAQKHPLDKATISKQICKTGNTEFEFENLEIQLDNNLFVSTNVLNELRRNAIFGYENILIEKYTHNLELKKFESQNQNNNNNTASSINNNESNSHQISLLLNYINLNYDYKKLQNINKLYIPLKYFFNNTYTSLLQNLSSNFNIYIYFPIVLKDNYFNNLNLDYILRIFSIKGFIVSNISQLELISKYNLEIIGNYTLNTFNTFEKSYLKNSGFEYTILSPELSIQEINQFNNSEIIVYGKIPVMTNGYCYLGKSNKCYKNCDKKCLDKNNNYYLKDRMNCKYRIIPDNNSTITTIYNYNPIDINTKFITSNRLRIDILDEGIEQIQKIISSKLL